MKLTQQECYILAEIAALHVRAEINGGRSYDEMTDGNDADTTCQFSDLTIAIALGMLPDDAEVALARSVLAKEIRTAAKLGHRWQEIA